MKRKKLWLSLLLALPLIAMATFVLSHPHVQQTLFGPRIKGQPLFVWQEQFRAEVIAVPPPRTLLDKVVAYFAAKRAEGRDHGAFLRDDPEMIPVLLSLADDPEKSVRIRVAILLMSGECDERVVSVLVKLSKDSDGRIRHAATSSLVEHGKKAATALPRVRELLKDENSEIKMYAAIGITRMIGFDKEAVGMLLEMTGIFDKDVPGQLGISRLIEVGKQSDEILSAVVDLCFNDPHTKHGGMCVRLLGGFGAKALPVLLPLLDHPVPAMRRNAMVALDEIGPAAMAAIPKLLELLTLETDPDNRERIGITLRRIDPKRFAKLAQP